MRVVTFDGDSYWLTIPHFHYFIELRKGRRDLLHTNHNCPNSVCLDFSKDKDGRFSLHIREIDESNHEDLGVSPVMFSSSGDAPVAMNPVKYPLEFLEKKQMGFRPCLIPLDRDGKPCTDLKVNPNWTTVSGGSLFSYSTKKTIKKTGQPYTLGSDLDIKNSCGSVRPMNWIYWNGMLVGERIAGSIPIPKLFQWGILPIKEIPLVCNAMSMLCEKDIT